MTWIFVIKLISINTSILFGEFYLEKIKTPFNLFKGGLTELGSNLWAREKSLEVPKLLLSMELVNWLIILVQYLY